MKAIKEAINQPHKHLYHKNRSIKDAKQLIEKGTYIGKAVDTKGRKRTYYYIKTQIRKEDAYIVIKEEEERKVFHTITDRRE